VAPLLHVRPGGAAGADDGGVGLAGALAVAAGAEEVAVAVPVGRQPLDQNLDETRVGIEQFVPADAPDPGPGQRAKMRRMTSSIGTSPLSACSLSDAISSSSAFI